MGRPTYISRSSRGLAECASLNITCLASLGRVAKVHHNRVKYSGLHSNSIRSDCATKPAKDWTPQQPK